MADIIETDRAACIRHVARIADDGKAALAAVQAVIDILQANGLCTERQVYAQLAVRLEDVRRGGLRRGF